MRDYLTFITSLAATGLIHGMPHNLRDLAGKYRVLRTSLLKVELAQYALKVRASEVPEWMLADLLVVMQRQIGDGEEMDE